MASAPIMDAEIDEEIENGPIFDEEFLEKVKACKINNPDQFVSFWEMDENDINEASAEEIESNSGLMLLKAAESGNKELVERLLSSDDSVLNYQDADGYTALHRASYEGHSDVLELLLSKGANIESQTADHWTPLHSACRWNEVKSVTVLLQHGANINSLTSSSQTPLHIAANFSENSKVLELLLSQPHIDISIKNSLGETAKDICTRCNPYEYLFDMAIRHSEI
ncbi:DgyrCDS8188 [Dimorphilus gyrociliatus]|uniref:DgyrCDS8188 n=1 Tax=Dimorphilus gyrociliatus TaxID=2664684 RepID=A0A7I8VTG3_9ANNE|nr:DgyrCDS8188 [Dimorphilus gyrociliatus]